MENNFCSKQKSIFTISQTLSMSKNKALNSDMPKADKLQDHNNLNSFSNQNKNIASHSSKKDQKSSNMNSHGVENMDTTETELIAAFDTTFDVTMQTNSGMHRNACESKSISNKHMAVTPVQFNQNGSKSSYNSLPCNTSELINNSEILEVNESRQSDSANEIKFFLANNSLALPSTSQEFSSKRANLNLYSLQTQESIKRHKPDAHTSLRNESSTNVDYASQIILKRHEIRNNIGEKVFLTSSSSNSLNTSNSISFLQNAQNSLLKDSPPNFSTAKQTDWCSIPRTSSFYNEVSVNLTNCTNNISPNQTSKDCGHSDTDDLFSVKKLVKNVRKTRSESSQIFFTNSKSSNNMLMLKGKPKYGLLSVFIEDFFKTTHPNLYLSSSICQRLELFLRDILFRIGDEAEALMILSDNKSFNTRVLKYAIKLCLQHIKNEADIITGKKTPWIF